MNLPFVSKIVSCLLVWLFLISLLGLTPVAKAQNLAAWSFGSSAAPTSVAANVMASNASYTTPTPVTAISGNRFSSQGWDVAMLDPTRYYDEKVTPSTGYKMTVTQLDFNLERTAASGPTSYEVRISLDGFSSFTSVGSGTIPQNTITNVSLPVGTVSQVTQTLTIRGYFWGATVAARTISIGSAAITGTVQTVLLPVTLANFKGQVAGNMVILNWATASEVNAEQFVVQRSADASEFVSVGSRQAAGTTDRQQYYSLTDESPRSGVNYYRLKQVDRDGSSVYSKAIAVRVDASQPYASLAENPTDGQAIQLSLYQMEAPQVRVSSLTGQNIAGQLSLRSPTEAMYTPTSALAPGLYIITVQEGAMRQAMKVLVR